MTKTKKHYSVAEIKELRAIKETTVQGTPARAEAIKKFADKHTRSEVGVQYKINHLRGKRKVTTPPQPQKASAHSGLK